MTPPPPTPSMRTLRCAVMGQRTVVTVEIEGDQNILRLKDAILAKRPLGVHPMMFSLHLAKRSDDPHRGWLHTTHEDYEALVQDDEQAVAMYTSTHTKMRACSRVDDYFPEQPDEHSQAIHVLVLMPTEAEMDRFRAIFGCDNTGKSEETSDTLIVLEPPPPQPEPLSGWIGRVVRDSVASWTSWMASEQTETAKPEKNKSV